jgi:arylsulfatase A-like enzyme
MPGTASTPNILLFVLDTARADAFEPYGAPSGSSPVIADLAARGWAAPLAFAPCNWTLPSHASMFTGLLPGALGLATSDRPRTATGMISKAVLEDHRDRVLPEVLRARGYETRAISANPWIHEVNGFATGFERFESVHGRPVRTGKGLRSKMERAIDAWVARADDGAAHIEGMLSSWLEEPPARPFFWFVNLMECHSPYLPPRPYNDLGAIARLRAAREADRHLTIEGIYRFCTRTDDISDAALGRMRHLYRRSVLLMDSLIGRVLEAFDARGMLDETIVVVTSDHGENLGENHLISHILSLDDRLLRVPLVAAGPVSLRRAPLTSVAELPALIGDAIGLAGHPWTEDVRAEGVVVSQAAAEMFMPIAEQLHQIWGLSEDAVRTVSTTMTCATDGRWKLVRDPAGERVYDLEADPGERNPIEPGTAEPGTVAKLRRAVDRAEGASSRVPVPPPGDQTPEAGSAEATELEERMRLLGYL